MIGDKIKEERLKRDMTQSELGKAIDVSPSTIGMYEQNRRQPDINTLGKIANYFNVTSDYLLGLTDDPNGEEEIVTIAAHHDGDEFTEEEKKEIEWFKQLVLDRRKKRD